MLIPLGTDNGGNPVPWDTGQSPLLSIVGPERSGKTTLIEAILSHTVDTTSAAYIGWRIPSGLPATVMTASYADMQLDSVEDLFQRIVAELKRSTEGAFSTDHPLLLVLDDFGRLARSAEMPVCLPTAMRDDYRTLIGKRVHLLRLLSGIVSGGDGRCLVILCASSIDPNRIRRLSGSDLTIPRSPQLRFGMLQGFASLHKTNAAPPIGIHPLSRKEKPKK